MAAPIYTFPFILCWTFFCLILITPSEASYLLEEESETESSSEKWLNHGGDLSNRRYGYKENKINPKTVPNLRLKWKFNAGKEITSTPAIYKGTIYITSWNGYVYAVKASDGSLVWQQNIQNITGIPYSKMLSSLNSTFSRATPTIVADDDDHDLVVVGLCSPAAVVAMNRINGELVWQTKLDNHFTAVITMSGTYYKGGFYVGTSSQEEIMLGIEQCCTFRGSLSKLDIKTGAILWQTYMVPDNNGTTGGYAGAAIWGSSPSIDPLRNLVYIATGNLYSVPSRISECQAGENNQTVPSHKDECVEADNHSDSILALDLDSGEIKWHHQLGGYDVWFASCNNLSTPNCPPGPNPDADFGEAPMMITINVNGSKHDVVVAAQKSGFVWALDRDNGNIVWFTQAGPGGSGGGGTWGAATDELRVYTNNPNTDRKNFTLVPSNEITKSGGWLALNASDGKILWAVADPSNINNPISGPVSVANGVMFAASTSPKGPIYAIDAKNGEILWSYENGYVGVVGGVSISDGCIYVGQGLSLFTFYKGYNKTAATSLFAFCV